MDSLYLYLYTCQFLTILPPFRTPCTLHPHTHTSTPTQQPVNISLLIFIVSRVGPATQQATSTFLLVNRSHFKARRFQLLEGPGQPARTISIAAFQAQISHFRARGTILHRVSRKPISAD